MTSVSFFRNKGIYTGFSVNGHSGYAEAGSDIVCAAISSCTELVLHQLCDVFSVDGDFSSRSETASVDFHIKDCGNQESSQISSRIIEGFYMTVLDIAKEYPRYVKCIITEV